MALRSAYFATFNGGPKVLLWGDAAGMHALSDFLRNLLTGPKAIALTGFCEPVDGKTINVRIRANRRDTGMRLNPEGLEWTLRAQSADDFAELVEGLAASGKSCHQFLSCGVTDEITVMVSH